MPERKVDEKKGKIERGVHLKGDLKRKAGVVAIWLQHCDWYMRQYDSERYNRDVQVHGWPQRLNHENSSLKRIPE